MNLPIRVNTAVQSLFCNMVTSVAEKLLHCCCKKVGARKYGLAFLNLGEKSKVVIVQFSMSVASSRLFCKMRMIV